jgi:Protein of unknown function (DUF2905)
MWTFDAGKTLIILGAVLLIMGLIVTFAGGIPFIGRLPGDIHIKRDGFSFYFPIVTCIILSIIVSALLYFFRR